MKPREEDTVMKEVCAILAEEGLPGLPELLGRLLNFAMKLERTDAIGAEPYERTEERQGYANGFKPKLLKTRVGLVPVEIPQVRGMSFYPQCLERGERSEKALKAALAQMYLQGVSTRKVTRIVEELCGLEVTSTQVSRITQELDEEFSKWRNRPLGPMRYVYLDARYEKVRYGGTVRDLAVLWAIGVTPDGHREILGVSVSLSEAEVHWRTFLKGLRDRGLSDLELIISDDHEGLKAARKSLFGSIPWQRCQFHLAQNAQHHATSLDQRREVALDLRDIFNAPDLVSANDRLKKIVGKYERVSPKLATWLEESLPEGFTVFAFPKTHQRKLRTSKTSSLTSRICPLDDRNVDNRFFKIERSGFSIPPSMAPLLRSTMWGRWTIYSLSNLASMLRLNLFTYRDLHEWLDDPFHTPPLTPNAVQLDLPLPCLGQPAMA